MDRQFDRRGVDAQLIPLLAIQPHQQAAVAKPHCPTALLARKRRLSANALARLVNDFLADPAVH